MPKLSAQDAIIHVLVMISASDREMADPELSRIGSLIRTKPVFKDFDQSRVLTVAQTCQQWLQREKGFEEILEAVVDSLQKPLRETAYAFAVDIAVSDIQVDPAEYRLLQILREALGMDRSTVNAIELAAKIRHRSL